MLSCCLVGLVWESGRSAEEFLGVPCGAPLPGRTRPGGYSPGRAPRASAGRAGAGCATAAAAPSRRRMYPIVFQIMAQILKKHVRMTVQYSLILHWYRIFNPKQITLQRDPAGLCARKTVYAFTSCRQQGRVHYSSSRLGPPGSPGGCWTRVYASMELINYPSTEEN